MRFVLRQALLIIGFGLVVSLLAPTLSWAQTSTPEQALQTLAGKFIQNLGDNAIRIIADKNLTQDQRSSKYRDLLHDAFDLKTIGHFVVGRAWDTATPDQQQEYMKLFEALVLKTYTDRLNFYSGESFHVKSIRQESDKDTVVGSEVTHPGGAAPTSIDWRVRQSDGKPAIVDVVIEGVSQSVTQRSEYASIIQRDGGKLDGLLALMHQKVQDGTPNSNGAQKSSM